MNILIIAYWNGGISPLAVIFQVTLSCFPFWHQWAVADCTEFITLLFLVKLIHHVFSPEHKKRNIHCTWILLDITDSLSHHLPYADCKGLFCCTYRQTKENQFSLFSLYRLFIHGKCDDSLFPFLLPSYIQLCELV